MFNLLPPHALCGDNYKPRNLFRVEQSRAATGVAGLVKDAARRACFACFEERGEHFGMSDWFDASTHI